MELLYLFIADDGMTIKDQSFNLSSRFNFSLTESEGNHTLSINKNPLYLDNFIGEDYESGYKGGYLMNITGIIGENGVGKTNLLKYIINLLNGELPFEEIFLAATLDSQKEIKIYFALGNTKLIIDTDFDFPIVVEPVEQKTVEVTDYNHYYRTPTRMFYGQQVIYYNPNFDTSEIGAGISIDNKNYVDISTSAIITRDLADYNESYADDIDKLSMFRSGNTRRQFNMFLDPELNAIKGLNLPKQIDIRFPRSHFYPDQAKRNLTYESRAIFDHIDELVKEGFNKANSTLNRLENKVEHGIQTEEYKAALKEKLKVEFTYAFVHNFFLNLNGEYNIDLKVKLEEIQGHDLFQRTADFLVRQQWLGRKGRVRAEDFFELMIKLIDELSLFVRDNDDHFTVDIRIGSLIINKYEEYMTSMPIEYKRNLFLYGWRNISSGENALLDLYTRLYFARKKRLKAPADDNRNLYILIDEGDSTFHPQWQRDYLSNLTSFIKGLFSGYRLQLLLTSHSPYLVSDLPRQNLIFLEKIDGLCKVSSLSNDENQMLLPTMAANINRLLGDQFFMRGEAIGKFAWERIEKELRPLETGSHEFFEPKRIEILAQIIGEKVLSSKSWKF